MDTDSDALRCKAPLLCLLEAVKEFKQESVLVDVTELLDG